MLRKEYQIFLFGIKSLKFFLFVGVELGQIVDGKI